jgi:hypothetical protein
MLITDRVAAILAKHPDIIVPVKQLWRDLQVEGLAAALPLEDFVGLLESDPRIEFMGDIDFGEGDTESEMAMDALGFISGPRVKLASRELTATHLAHMLDQSTQRLVDALKGAWELRPEDDPETDLQLLMAIEVAEELQRNVRATFEDDLETSSNEQPAEKPEAKVDES